MSDRSNSMLRGGMRATVGVLVIGSAAATAVLLNTVPLPSIERAAVAVTVDALHGAEQSLVCPGSFAELGADPSRPSIAVPSGTAVIAIAGDVTGDFELSRTEPGGSLPQVLRAPAGEAVAAAQSQFVATESLRGLSTASCAEPVHEQWLLGGSTSLGVTTTLSLGNPSDVPATVQLTLYDERGVIDETSTSGVLVPARSERTVSLNGYAPGRESLAVRVVSTGSAVTASLGVAQTDTLTPFAVDTVTRQLVASTTLVIPGVTNLSTHQHGGPGDAGELDPFPVVVRVLAPGGESGTATVRAVCADGTSEVLGQLEFAGSAVVSMPVQHWPQDANAVVIDANAPLFGGVLGSSDDGTEHDYAWFAPAPELPVDSDVAAPVVAGGQLVIVNTGQTAAQVGISDATGASPDREVSVPAGAAVPVSASGGAILSSSAPVYAGVRVTAGGIAGYPILTAADRVSTLTVFTR